MTIANTSNKVVANGNAATTNWPFTFLIPDAASLLVYYTDANGLITSLPSSQYTVAGLNNPNGGSVNYPLSGSPIAVGTTLTIYRSVAYTQQRSIQNQGGFFPDVYEAALDYLTMQTQQLNELVGRSLTVPVSITGVTTALPTPLANAAIGWNATGTALVNMTALAGSVSLPLSIANGGTGQAGLPASLDALMTKGADIVAAANVNLDTATGDLVDVTGNTGITSITLSASKLRWTRFTGTPAITNGASLILPGGANLQIAAGDIAQWRGYAGGIVRLVGFIPFENTIPSKLPTAAGDILVATAARTLARAGQGMQIWNGTLTATQNGTVLTIAVKTTAGNDPSDADPVFVFFRNVTSKTGDVTIIKLNAATSIATTVGGTFGVANAVPFRLWVVGFNDGGTFRLAVINCLTTVAGAGAGRDVTAIFPLSQFAIASATQIGAGSTLSQTFYSAGAAVASKAYATLGYLTYEAGLAAAGTFNVDQSRLDLYRAGNPLPGQVLQVQRNDSGAVATGTTLIPDDDTIPQITEGDQYLSQPITPSSAANVLDVEYRLQLAHSAGSCLTSSLHQDATLNALAIVNTNPAGIVNRATHPLFKRILAAGTAATTLRARAGSPTAGTTTFNGGAGLRLYGGVDHSFIECREVMA